MPHLELVQNAFVASGLNEQSAQSVARALVMAEAEGQVGTRVFPCWRLYRTNEKR
jgi:LDH2 family malate/lactate/ureidoglycolate dehydrogenase